MKLEEFKEICAKFGLKAVASKYNGEKWTCYQYNNRVQKTIKELEKYYLKFNEQRKTELKKYRINQIKEL